MMKPLLIILTVILLLPNFLKKDINQQLKYNGLEKYNSSLGYIQNLDQLEFYADSLAIEKNIDPQSAEYFQLLEDIISRRFYHGFSHYNLSENWIAALGQKVTGIGLACKVDPSDILKDPSAACSQQSIVMMEIIKRKELDYRKVGFPHHYALELKVKDQWYFFDANMEPSMTLDERNHAAWAGENDSLKKFYNSRIYPDLDYGFGKSEKAMIGVANTDPAPNLSTFHQLTAPASKFLWVIPFMALLFLSFKSLPGLSYLRLKRTAKPEFSI